MHRRLRSSEAGENPYIQSEELQLPVVGAGYGLKIGHLRTARRALGAPEDEDDRFASQERPLPRKVAGVQPPTVELMKLDEPGASRGHPQG